MANRFFQWNPGQLVQSVDMISVQEAVKTLQGVGLAAIMGGYKSFNPAGAYATVFVPGPNSPTPTTGTMQVSFGDGGDLVGGFQYLVIQNRIILDMAKQVITLGANGSGSVRNDIITATYAETNQGAGFVRSVKDPGTGILTTPTVYQTNEGVTINTVVGTPGAGDPTFPSSQIGLIRVRVPSTGTIDATMIDVLLPSAQSILKALVGSGKVGMEIGFGYVSRGDAGVAWPSTPISSVLSSPIIMGYTLTAQTPPLGGSTTVLLRNSGPSMVLAAGLTSVTVTDGTGYAVPPATVFSPSISASSATTAPTALSLVAYGYQSTQ